MRIDAPRPADRRGRGLHSRAHGDARVRGRPGAYAADDRGWLAAYRRPGLGRCGAPPSPCGAVEEHDRHGGRQEVYPEDVESAFDGVPCEELAVFASNFVWPETRLTEDALLAVVRGTEDAVHELRKRNLRLRTISASEESSHYDAPFPRTASMKLKRDDLAKSLRESTRPRPLPRCERCRQTRGPTDASQDRDRQTKRERGTLHHRKRSCRRRTLRAPCPRRDRTALRGSRGQRSTRSIADPAPWARNRIGQGRFAQGKRRFVVLGGDGTVSKWSTGCLPALRLKALAPVRQPSRRWASSHWVPALIPTRLWHRARRRRNRGDSQRPHKADRCRARLA